ncbi:hypothetical protein HD554DRAFT_2060427 [Boletus coccyginus]|nr:hypothetical protein HD554DRAFT_2060427 [Boletus coccyginus]
MFEVFGVIQKRQVCRSAVLQIRKRDFIQHQEAFLHLKPGDLKQAGVEEDQHRQITNPIVRALRKHLTAVRASLWITINPSDVHDPVAQVFTGADIDLDRFVSSSGPDSQDRAARIAQDPYAAAKFFHISIQVVLEMLFGITCYWNSGGAGPRNITPAYVTMVKRSPTSGEDERIAYAVNIP